MTLKMNSSRPHVILDEVKNKLLPQLKADPHNKSNWTQIIDKLHLMGHQLPLWQDARKVYTHLAQQASLLARDGYLENAGQYMNDISILSMYYSESQMASFAQMCARKGGHYLKAGMKIDNALKQYKSAREKFNSNPQKAGHFQTLAVLNTSMNKLWEAGEIGGAFFILGEAIALVKDSRDIEYRTYGALGNPQKWEFVVEYQMHFMAINAQHLEEAEVSKSISIGRAEKLGILGPDAIAIKNGRSDYIQVTISEDILSNIN